MNTSFRDLGEGETSAPLQVDVVGIDEGTQSSEGFSSEEVGLSALDTCISFAVYLSEVVRGAYVFQEA
jgi:hypothetical protein